MFNRFKPALTLTLTLTLAWPILQTSPCPIR